MNELREYGKELGGGVAAGVGVLLTGLDSLDWKDALYAVAVAVVVGVVVWLVPGKKEPEPEPRPGTTVTPRKRP